MKDGIVDWKFIFSPISPAEAQILSLKLFGIGKSGHDVEEKTVECYPIIYQIKFSPKLFLPGA